MYLINRPTYTALTGILLQRVLVERPSISRQLYVRTVDWQGVFREGIPCFAQTSQWLEGMFWIQNPSRGHILMTGCVTGCPQIRQKG
jgi:hypothetical protein